MSAASAKRPASKTKTRTSRAAAKRAAQSPSRRRAGKADRPADIEALDGPGYQFAGFRMMCRHRHVRH